MPYFIFHVTESENAKKELQHLDTFDKYQDAKAYSRAKRAELSPETPHIQIKMMHAGTLSEAEILLTTTREAPIIGDD